ncbi:MAG TPA: hypothetical protein PKA38_02710 [Candidatus Levybacteria bacterium]|nr:hypothetical protein [Candidatus Levybacteria bacterium]
MKKLLKRFSNKNNFLEGKLLFFLVAVLIVFIPLYPKLPAIGVNNTWVYIRLEDFLIAFTTFVFLIQLLRRRVHVSRPLGIPIVAYWIAGFLSLLISIVFLAPHLANFFPHVAILSYLRRIEYMVLFFVGYAVIKEEKDIRRLFWVLAVTTGVAFIYGIGQRYYINVWAAFPDFFEKYSFCFPSFQTTNEEFAKGIPLCLPSDGRITSLFGGHYDLSAYLVLVIPIIFSVAFAMRKRLYQILLLLLGTGLVYLLILTASRISFGAYIVGIIFALVFIRKKMIIIPILIISLFFLVTSSSSVLQRFTQTFRFTNLVINSQGQVVGEAVNKLPEQLKKKISHEPIIVEAPPPTQELPTGSSYIALPGKTESTSSAVLKSSPKLSKEEKSKYKFGAVEISNVQGNFLIQRALVYDISFTTRFQGEWPNTWRAFMRNPIFGSGYATITLSSDNSFLRALGEVGVLGFITFFSFFILWYIYVKNNYKEADRFTRNFVLGLSAGVIGLFLNAVLIDVFEASKVAESMWLLLGIGAGGIALYAKNKFSYLHELRNILSSSLFLMIYLLILFFVFLGSSFNNFFVGDDFTWLRWAAQSDNTTLVKNFYDAQGFFLRPIDKLLIFVQYTLFNLKPLPHHLFTLFYNFGVSIVVYFLLFRIFKKKSTAFLGAFIFSFIPSHSQNLFWIATISTTVSTFFVLLGLFFYSIARKSQKILYYICAFILFLLAIFSYENAIIFIGLMVVFDMFIANHSGKRQKMQIFLPYLFAVVIVGFYLLVRINAHAAGFSGDYNYNLLKLIPNTIGNYLGYIALFFGSESTLSSYTYLRNIMKQYVLVLSFIGFMFIAFVAGFVIEHKERFSVSNRKKIFIFGFIFSIVALLPYLPLGNITLRYLYLPSFGFVVMVITIFDFLFSKITVKKWFALVYSLVIIMLGLMFYVGLTRAERYWDEASKITYDTLVRFRLDYDLKNNTNLYFYNVPIRNGEAYIFPVGLADAIYFVNTDKSVKVYQVKDRKTAENLKNSVPAKVLHTGIFTFDKNKMLDFVEYSSKE